MARLRGRRWQADIRLPDGERLRPTFPTEAEADAWEAQARLAIEQGKPLPELRNASRPGSATRDLLLLGNLYDHVCRTAWDHMRAGEKLKYNGQTAVDHWGRNREVSTITSADIAEYAVVLANRGLAPATINRKIASVSKMLGTARDAGVIEKVPKIDWRREEKTRFRYVDEKEEGAILAYFKAMNWDRDHDMAVLLLDTGARCFAEMFPVKWDAFGPKFSTVTFWHTKTFKPRTVPLTKRCRDLLTEIKRQRPASKGPFEGHNKNTFAYRWKYMQEATKLFDVTPHTLRHTCCTRLVFGGVDVKRIMEWMGHSAIVTTMRYMQIRPDSLDELVNVLEGRRAA